MDMYERIKKSIDFIEINLTEHISLNEVASKAFCSLSYFHNVFCLMAGIALKEYIRNRILKYLELLQVCIGKITNMQLFFSPRD